MSPVNLQHNSRRLRNDLLYFHVNVYKQLCVFFTHIQIKLFYMHSYDYLQHHLHTLFREERHALRRMAEVWFIQVGLLSNLVFDVFFEWPIFKLVFLWYNFPVTNVILLHIFFDIKKQQAHDPHLSPEHHFWVINKLKKHFFLCQNLRSVK